MPRNRTLRTKPLTTIRVHIPSSEMRFAHELIHNANGREHGGVFEITKKNGTYTAHISRHAIVRGNSSRFMTAVPNYRDGVYISFHTHPNMAYKKLACVLGPPSVPDYKVAFQRCLLGETAHLVFTVEGMYTIRLGESPLRFFRDLVMSPLFTNKNSGIQIMMSTLDIVNTVMGPKEKEKCVNIATKFRNMIQIRGNDQLRMYVNANGPKQNADFLLQQLTRANINAIRTYAKKLYKETMASLRTIRVGTLVDSLISFLRPQGLTTDHMRLIERLLSKYPGVRNESVFHARLYHRSPGNDHTYASLMSDYTKPISFTILVDSVHNIRTSNASPVREEFTSRTSTPESFIRLDTSPYNRKRPNRPSRNTRTRKRIKRHDPRVPTPMNTN